MNKNSISENFPNHFQRESLNLIAVARRGAADLILHTVYLPKRYGERDNIQQSFTLTDRELDVVELIVAGASNKIIARELALSLATIKTHIQHIFHKVEVSSRTSLSARVVAELNP